MEITLDTAKGLHEVLPFSKELCEGFEFVDDVQGEDRRWTRTNQLIVRKDGKLYSMQYEHPLTEQQEGMYDEDIYPQYNRETKMVVLDEVEREEVTTYRYKKVEAN